MKVWVVTFSVYPFTDVVGAFSSKKKAKRACKNDNYFIECRKINKLYEHIEWSGAFKSLYE